MYNHICKGCGGYFRSDWKRDRFCSDDECIIERKKRMDKMTGVFVEAFPELGENLTTLTAGTERPAIEAGN